MWNLTFLDIISILAIQILGRYIYNLIKKRAELQALSEKEADDFKKTQRRKIGKSLHNILAKGYDLENEFPEIAQIITRVDSYYPQLSNDLLEHYLSSTLLKDIESLDSEESEYWTEKHIETTKRIRQMANMFLGML